MSADESGNPKEQIENCVIVGVGLMGGSLGLALREAGLAARVVGVDRSEATLAAAVTRGAINEGTTAISDAVSIADVVVLSAPVGTIPSLLEQIAPLVRPETLVTDLGSTKVRIVETGQRVLGAQFVGGHPMAGSERGGIEAARADLFRGAAWAVMTDPILRKDNPAIESGNTKQPPNETIFVRRLLALIDGLKAHPVFLQAQAHDQAVALVSHLPHVLSFAYADTVAAYPESETAQRLAAGSFRDFMRVSGADKALWRDIFQNNKAALKNALDLYQAQLDAVRNTLLEG